MSTQEKKSMVNALKLGGRITALVLAAGIAAGCDYVTKAQLDEVKSAANSALSEARAAKTAADNAQRTASEAAEAARRAQTAASAAQTCCNDNTKKIQEVLDRILKK
ncbi:MAG: hypothetical protein IT494_04370 [Gammaproteobacteria bacterium]|nr:hypothetical protein [Gammaproteobacteria bacterium]